MTGQVHYSGDVDCEHGGFWYDLSDWHNGYADCLRITPCSDAGGPSNLYWVEPLTVLRPDSRERLKSVLGCMGATALDLVDHKTRKHRILEACLGYGLYDPASYAATEVVQVGPAEEHDDLAEWPKPTVRLRSNANLHKWCERHFAEIF